METYAEDVKNVSKKFGIQTGTLLCNLASNSDELLSFLKSLDQYVNECEQRDDLVKFEVSALRKQRVNAEHQLSQIEKQLISCNSVLLKETKDAEQAKERLETTDRQLSETEISVRKLEKEKEQLDDRNEQLTKKASQLENENAEVLEILEKKNKEVERLNEEWKLISEKLAKANKAKFETESKLDEIQSHDITREFKEKRLEQEKDMLGIENEQLRKDLQSKTDELVSIKKDKTNQLLNLKGTGEQQEEEIKQMKTRLENYKKSTTDQEQKINSLITKLKKARDEFVDMEGHMQKELSAKAKLVILYKESSDSEKQRVKELTTAVEGLQSLLKQATQSKTGNESKLEVKEKQHSRIVNELDEKVKKLQVELENVNELLEVSRKRGHQQLLSEEQLREMSPTAAAASSLIRKGMTLTQIYSEYVQVSDELQSEKDENTRLKQYLDQIVEEIEEKAPLLQQQKQHYVQALKTVDVLTGKFDEAMAECERYRTESEDVSRKADYQKSENIRLNNLCADLSQQVRVLLKESEEARGAVVSSVEEPPMISSTDVSSSAQVISEHLVSFKNIEDCQTQNQKLLAVVRELSEEREKQEKERSSERFDELKNTLESATEQINLLKVERQRQEDMIQTIGRQRDMYKVLFSIEGEPPESTLGKSTKTPFTKSNPDMETLENEVTKARAAEDRVSEEFDDYKKKQTTKERSILEKLKNMEENLASVRIENQRFKGQMEMTDERKDTVVKHNEGLKREVDALIQKSTGLETAFSKAQSEAISYKQELDGMKEKTIAADVRSRTLDSEKKMIKDREERLLAENKSLLEQQRSRNVLLTNLQSIQNNLERQEFETRKKLGSQIDNLQRELKGLRRKLDTESEVQQKASKAYDERSKHLRTQLDVAQKAKNEAKTELEGTKKEVEPLQVKVSELEEQLKASESRYNMFLQSIDKEKVDKEKMLDEKYQINAKSLERKVGETTSRIKALQSQLESANKHIAQFKEIAACNEKALQGMTKEKENVNQMLNALQKRHNDTSKQLDVAKNEVKQRKSETERKERELLSTVDELKGSLSVVQGEVSGAKKIMKIAQDAEATAKAEAIEQATVANETQEKYERELVLHSKDVEALVKAKEQLHEYVTLVDNTESQVEESQEKLDAADKNMEAMKRHHEEEKKKMQTNYKQMSDQNAILHNEIEKLSGQLVGAKAQLAEFKPTSEELENPEKESEEDLHEVIKYIRREKEIAETKSEAALSECLRFKQRFEHLEKEFDETVAALETERKITEGEILSKDEHADIKSKIAKVNELSQLKEQLQKEKENLEDTNKGLEEKNRQLENDLSAVHENKKQLEDDKDALVAEKTALKGEIQRWTQRTQQLIEQSSNKADAEEFKNLQEEFKSLQNEHKKLQDGKILNDRSVSALKDENQRSKSFKEIMQKEMLKLKSDLSESTNKAKQLQTIVDNTKTEREDMENSLNQEIEILKNDRDEKDGTITEKNRLIAQLKKLAKKYKTQFEEQQQTEKKAEAPLAGENVEGQEKIQVELEETKKQLEEVRNNFEQSQQKVRDCEKMLSESNDEMQNLAKENEKNKSALTEKDDKNKKVLRSVKERITLLTVQKDKASGEAEDLKKTIKDITEKYQASEQTLQEKEMRLTVLGTQYDSKISRLERDLQEEMEKVQTLSESNQQLEHEKKDAEKSAKQAKATAAASEVLLMAKVRAQAVAKAVQEAATVELLTAPLTATVRPTSSVPNQQQKAISSRTASIRPLASSTPTAMVSPTVPPVQQQTTTNVVAPQVAPVVAQPTSTSTAGTTTEHRPQLPEITPGPSRSQTAAAVFKAPMVRVSAHVQEDGRVEPVSTTTASIPEPSRQEGDDLLDEDDETLQAQEVARAVSMLDGDEDESAGHHPDQSSRSEAQYLQRRRLSDTTASKRRRSLEQVAEQSVFDVHDGAKRARVQENLEQSDDFDIQDETERAPVQVDLEQSISSSDYKDIAPAVVILDDDDIVDDEETDEDDDEEVKIQPYLDQEYDDEDDEEEMDADMGEMEEDNDEESNDDEEEEGEIIEEDEELDEEVEHENDNQSIDEDDDDEEEQEERTTQDTTMQHRQQLTRQSAREQQLPSRRQPSPAAAMLVAPEQGGRGRFLRTRYQLPSFSLPPGHGGSGGPFDEADDSIVPSTPTLFMPKRTDGFAEAVSSPHVGYPVFSFADPSQGTSQGSGLDANNEEGLRLDETRIDLLAGEEPASVPRTPLGIVPSVPIPHSQHDSDNTMVSRPNEASMTIPSLSCPPGVSESNIARVSKLHAEDVGQEQNVPQQIDLTEDDDGEEIAEEDEEILDEEDIVEIAANADGDDLLEEESQDGEERDNQDEEIMDEELEEKEESQEDQRSDKEDSKPPERTKPVQLRRPSASRRVSARRRIRRSHAGQATQSSSITSQQEQPGSSEQEN